MKRYSFLALGLMPAIGLAAPPPVAFPFDHDIIVGARVEIDPGGTAGHCTTTGEHALAKKLAFCDELDADNLPSVLQRPLAGLRWVEAQMRFGPLEAPERVVPTDIDMRLLASFAIDIAPDGKIIACRALLPWRVNGEVDDLCPSLLDLDFTNGAKAAFSVRVDALVLTQVR